MTPPRDQHDDSLLDAYLDGVATDGERAAAEQRMAESPEWQQARDLQQSIDRAIRRKFPIAAAPPGVMTSQVVPSARSSGSGGLSPAWRKAAPLLAVVACGLLVAAGLWWRNSGERTVFFEPRPVAQIYRESVAAGFEPYYECRDPERFAAVFRTRQQTPLELLPMPAGRQMLGLSYPGGLSRDTTAMLCEVEGERVMVFVDRKAADFAGAAANTDPTVKVFRDEREGLVFYEVTPLDSPQMTQLLRTRR